MSRMVRTRILLFLTGLILVPATTYFVVLFAKGYRPNFVTKTISATGILAVKSNPDAAQIYVDREFRGATNSNFTLSPGKYNVEVRKDTYSTWKKTLTIQPEEVARAYVTLFPTIPSLRAVTVNGAATPTISPDGTKIAFFSNSNVYILDITDSPLGLLNRDSQLVYQMPSTVINPKIPINKSLTWAPDSRQLLIVASPSAILVDLANNSHQELVAGPATMIRQWDSINTLRQTQKNQLLPETMRNILATASAEISWAPKETKLIYTATASASIPEKLIRPLPGSSTQTQSRTISAGQTYVYDIEEDRNFNIQCPIANIRWFATSEHLMCIDKNKISIMDYDDLNTTVVYSGPMDPNYVFSYPSANQILILANLTPENTNPPNLYALDLN